MNRNKLRAELINYRSEPTENNLLDIYRFPGLLNECWYKVKDDEELREDYQGWFGLFLVEHFPKILDKAISARNPAKFLANTFRWYVGDQQSTGRGITVHQRRIMSIALDEDKNRAKEGWKTIKGTTLVAAGTMYQVQTTRPYDEIHDDGMPEYDIEDADHDYEGHERISDILDDLVQVEYKDEEEISMVWMKDRDRKLVHDIKRNSDLDPKDYGFTNRERMVEHMNRLSKKAPKKPTYSSVGIYGSQSIGSTKSAQYVTETDFNTKMGLLRASGFSHERQIGRRVEWS